MRIDTFLAEKGLAKSRSFAKTLIEEGFVEVNGSIVSKASLDVSDDDVVVVTGVPYKFVGRGGIKLDTALKAFSVNVSGMIAVDIGASTGGFTHCLILNGAKKVYAVDIGHGQLDTSLTSDERVINMEGINARYLTSDQLGEKCDIAVSDISFISQTYVIPQINDLLKEDGIYIALIKPQFECGKQNLGKNGIVKNKKVIFDSVSKVIKCVTDNGIGVLSLIVSPIEGGDGNTEFLMLCKKGEKTAIDQKFVSGVCGL